MNTGTWNRHGTWVSKQTNQDKKYISKVISSMKIAWQWYTVYNNGSWTKNCEAVQMPPLLQLQKLLGKGEGGLKKVSLHCSLADQNIQSLWGKKCIWGHPIARATSYCLLPDTFCLRASKNVFKVGNVKSQIHCHRLPLWISIVKKVRTRSKSSQGT